MSDRYYEEARAVAIACLIRHGQFSPEDAPVAYADGCIEACAECIAAALRARDSSEDAVRRERELAAYAGWRSYECTCGSWLCPQKARDEPVGPPCSQCGGAHAFDTSIDSAVWNRVIRGRGLPDYLCVSCIIRAFVGANESFTARLWGLPADAHITATSGATAQAKADGAKLDSLVGKGGDNRRALGMGRQVPTVRGVG